MDIDQALLDIREQEAIRAETRRRDENLEESRRAEERDEQANREAEQLRATRADAQGTGGQVNVVA